MQICSHFNGGIYVEIYCSSTVYMIDYCAGTREWKKGFTDLGEHSSGLTYDVTGIAARWLSTP